MRVGITVREALQLPSLGRGRVLAGAGGLGRLIRHVNVMEVPDILPFVKGHELLLTTAYPLRDDPDMLTRLVPQLAERELAALAIVPRAFLAELPAEALARADALRFPIIELPNQTSFNDIMAEVLEPILDRNAVQLERSQAIHERLTAVVLRGGSLADLLGALTELLECSVEIIDAHGRTLASSRSPQGDASSWTDGDDVRRPISVGGTKFGEILISAGPDTLGAEHQMAIEQATTIAALQMAQTRAVLSRERRYQAVLLDELVSDYSLRIEEAIEHASALGWDLGMPRAALVVDLQEAVSGRDVSVAGQPLEDRLVDTVGSVLDERAIVWARRSGLALLLDARVDPPTAAQQVIENVQRAAPELHAAVGIGRPSSGPYDLHRSYREATQALVVRRDLGGGGPIVSYDRLGIYRLLHRLSSDPELESYCQDLLGRVLDHDSRRGTDLVATLESYLRNNRNMAATARDLSVHYNTVRYRLRKIDDLVGGIDRHPDSRIGLELALHARRLISSRAWRASVAR